MVSTALALGFGPPARAQDFDHTHTLFSGVVSTHVVNGQVDYKGLKADPKALDRYLTALATVSEVQLQSWTEPQKLAFFVNLYNASTLHLILDNYPVKSIKDIGSLFTGPWDQPAVRMFGKTVNLNTLEHEMLRKQYHEPRLHMALVCAAKGCPPLRSEAYTAERLNEQLDDQSRTYLASPAGLHLDRAGGVIQLSSIFKWYGADFIQAYAGRITTGPFSDAERYSLGFVSRYVSKPDQAYIFGGHYQLRYLDYDWSLNERIGTAR
jgi:hypothetical protein